MNVRIGSKVNYKREGYSFKNGRVTGLDQSSNRALVCWQDSSGQHRESLCGVEFLTRQTKTKTPTSKLISAS